jgi:hypothetical protein
MSSDFIHKVRERAYQIWEREGCPEGRENEHWHRAEQELADEDASGSSPDAGGQAAAHEYDHHAGKFGKTGQAEAQARAARESVDRPQAEDLKRAEAAGRSRNANHADQ